ncbi:hypothetical protein ACFQ14_16015 [Pseudahrensia aquimaris]|uniref:Uncharacterized protein n=1 Tax=Pseudahrensia aquimaris TaxID=744461 RepID=A0ABW3FHE2_9HYPH
MRSSLFALCGVVALTACSQSVGTSGSLSAYSAPISSVTVCSGYGCVLKDRMTFSPAQESRLKAIMASASASPEAERAAIKQAIAAMEKMSQKTLRLVPDVGRSWQRYSGGLRGQMDCVDETRNTQSYLGYLASRGWLNHHSVARSYVGKGIVLDGNMPHRSAVIVAKSGTRYAVDSWPKDNGAPPLIVPVPQWRKMDI